MSREDSRIRDGVRDSKIRKDISSKLDQKSDSFTSGLNQTKAGLRHPLKHDYHQVRRDIPRVSAVDIGDRFHYRNHSAGEDNRRWFRSILPTFNGDPIIEDFWEWIDSIEDYFEEMQPPDKLRCKLASYTLIGVAEGWWNQLKYHRRLQGKSKIVSWYRMKHLLAKRFLHPMCSTKFLQEDYDSSYREEYTYVTSNGTYLATGATVMRETSTTAKHRRRTEKQKKSSLDEVFVGDQSKEIVEMIPAKCSIKVPIELYEPNQIGCWGSTNEFHYSSSSTTDVDVGKNTKCRVVSSDAPEHEVADDTGVNMQQSVMCYIDGRIEFATNNLDVKKTTNAFEAPTTTPLVSSATSTEEEIPIPAETSKGITGHHQPESKFLSPELLYCVDECDNKNKTEQTFGEDADFIMVKGPGKEALYAEPLKMKDHPLSELLETEMVAFTGEIVDQYGEESEAEHDVAGTVKSLTDVSQVSSASFVLMDVPKLEFPLKYDSPTHVVPVNPSILKTTIPISLVNGLWRSSNISRIGSETGFATKLYNTMGERSQRQISLEPNNVDFPVDEMPVVNFDPGGVASQLKFMNGKALTTLCCSDDIWQAGQSASDGHEQPNVMSWAGIIWMNLGEHMVSKHSGVGATLFSFDPGGSYTQNSGNYPITNHCILFKNKVVCRSYAEAKRLKISNLSPKQLKAIYTKLMFEKPRAIQVKTLWLILPSLYRNFAVDHMLGENGQRSLNSRFLFLALVTFDPGGIACLLETWNSDFCVPALIELETKTGAQWLAFQNDGFVGVTKPMCRFVHTSVDAYLAPFVKEFLYGFRSQFDEIPDLHPPPFIIFDTCSKLVLLMGWEYLVDISYIDDTHFVAAHDGSTMVWKSNLGSDHTKLMLTLKGHSITTLTPAVKAKGMFSGSVGSTLRACDFETRQCREFVNGHKYVVSPPFYWGCYLLSKTSSLKTAERAFIYPQFAYGFISELTDLSLDKEFMPRTVDKLRIIDVLYIPMVEVPERLSHILRHLKVKMFSGVFSPYSIAANDNREDNMDVFLYVEGSQVQRNIMPLFMQVFFMTCSKIVFPFHPWENYICISDRRHEYFFITRARVIPLEGWKDVDNSNGQFREASKLFHKIVNGLDPPTDMRTSLGGFNVHSDESLVDELFEETDGMM